MSRRMRKLEINRIRILVDGDREVVYMLVGGRSDRLEDRTV